VLPSTSAETGLLGIYLNDHLATFTLSVDLARRAAGGERDGALADTLDRLAAELEADRDALREVMRSLDVGVRQYKVLAARVAERIGRFKPNGHLLSRSPLSTVLETEGLGAAIEANASCWRTLRELADADPRLDVDRMRTLLARAQRQAETAAECRRQAVAAALGAPSPEASAEEPAAPPASEEPAPPVAPPLPEATVPAPAHEDLPLPDYDHLPIGSLAARIRTLDPAGIEQLLAYERAHADRPQVLLFLQRRREELAQGAAPTAGDAAAQRPEASPAGTGGSPVSPATAGPPINPPSHGVPTNPAQPRT
jgi:hypothetical protein